MKDELKKNSELTSGADAKGQFLVYQAEDGKLKLDVRFEDESVWLTQPLMAELFQTTQQNVSQHILILSCIHNNTNLKYSHEHYPEVTTWQELHDTMKEN